MSKNSFSPDTRIRRQWQSNTGGERQSEHRAENVLGRGQPPDGIVGQRQDQPIHVQRRR